MSLTGKTFLVTRALEQAPELSALINEYGGIAIEVPLIAFKPYDLDKHIDGVLTKLSQYNWLMFTSVNGVHFFMKRYNEMYSNKFALPKSIAVVGEKTQAALLTYNIKVDLIPTDYTAEGMVEVLEGHIHAGDRILLARGNRGRSVLNNALAKIGAQLDDLTIYQTYFPKEAETKLNLIMEKKEPIDYVLFTSSSTVTHYVELIKKMDCKQEEFNPKIACIGPVAAKTATDLGLCVDVIPEKYTIESLIEQLIIDSNKGSIS